MDKQKGIGVVNKENLFCEFCEYGNDKKKITEKAALCSRQGKIILGKVEVFAIFPCIYPSASPTNFTVIPVIS